MSGFGRKTILIAKNMRRSFGGGAMLLALLVEQGRLFRFRPMVYAVVNDELSPAVTRLPGTKSHQFELA